MQYDLVADLCGLFEELKELLDALIEDMGDYFFKIKFGNHQKHEKKQSLLTGNILSHPFSYFFTKICFKNPIKRIELIYYPNRYMHYYVFQYVYMNTWIEMCTFIRNE